MVSYWDCLKQAILEFDSIVTNKAELRRDKKLEELIDRVGSRNLVVLLKLPNHEKKDILKRLKKTKEIR